VAKSSIKNIFAAGLQLCMAVTTSFRLVRHLFATFDEIWDMNFTIETEQEAAAAILFSCVMYKHKNLTQSQVDQLSRIVVLCSKFKGTDLNQLTIKPFLYRRNKIPKPSLNKVHRLSRKILGKRCLP
jgi:hypothetical protein